MIFRNRTMTIKIGLIGVLILTIISFSCIVHARTDLPIQPKAQKKAARVSLVATDKVWIEVRDVEADRVLLEKTLDVGDKYNPDEDSEGLVLKTTNAGGLDVYIDGKKKKALGNKGQTKAGITLDAAGLTGK